MKRASSKRQFKHLSNVEHVRMRTGMWLGQNSRSTYMQHFIHKDNKEPFITYREVTEIPAKMKCLDEACMNAVDEYHRNQEDKSMRRKDKMNLLEVTLSEDKKRVTVKDNGRGIPAKNADNVFLHLMYGENFDDEASEHISGQNGVGISLVRIVSSHFRVITYHQNEFYQKLFTLPSDLLTYLRDELSLTEALINRLHKYFDEHGNIKDFKGLSPHNKKILITQMKRRGMLGILKENKEKAHGTCIEYELDARYFNGLDMAYRADLIEQYLQDLAMTTPGLHITYRHGDCQKDFHFPKGLETFLSHSSLPYYKMHYTSSDKSFQFESYVIAHKGSSLSWVNATHVSLGGSSIEYLHNRLCDLVRKKPSIIHCGKRMDIAPTRNDVKNCFHMLSVISMKNPRFKSQDKSYLINDLNAPIREALDQHLEKLLRKIDLIHLVKQEIQKRSSLQAMDQSLKVYKQTSKRIIPKLIDINQPIRGSETTLFIAEGDSAIAGLRPVRNPREHALFPLKGKPLNVKGMSIYKTMENQEMRHIIMAIDLPIETKVDSLKTLKYSRVTIITDADHDGYAIRSLMFNFFLEYWPELFSLGFIYMTEAPLYEVLIQNQRGQKKTFFCKHEADYEALMEKVSASKSTLVRKKRNKGLGETSREAMHYAIYHCMHPISIRDLEEARNVQNLWFHKKYADERRQVIAQYSSLLLDD